MVNKNEYKVVDDSGKEVALPALLKDFRGDKVKVLTISRLPFEGSTGRVDTVRGEFYPTVFGLKIVRR